MSPQRIIHATFSIERHYPHAPEKVFQAFADPAKKPQWFAEVEGFELKSFEMDFRILGRETCEFIHPGGPQRYREGRNDTIYMDIVENRHIVIAYIMTFGDHCMSSSQTSMEFVPDGDQTRLVFTEQAAFFDDADGPQLREDGTQWLLDRLGQKLKEWAS